MADKTGISWCEASWNPIVGCSIVSAGCTNCYAMQQAHRMQAQWQGKHLKHGDGTVPQFHYDGTTKVVNGNPVWTGALKHAPEHILLQPLKWKRPRKIFVNSMSDLFHESVPDEWIDRVFAVMALCPQHTFQILTKRSKRMRRYFEAERNDVVAEFAAQWADYDDIPEYDVGPLPHIWLGVSCEDQHAADERIPDLLATPAAVRLVSAEPLLGPIDFGKCKGLPVYNEGTGIIKLTTWGEPIGARHGRGWVKHSGNMQPWLDWIIVGGESGPGFRPMQIEWAESIREQCEAAGTAFFFKQDSGPRSGMRGRASDALWACKNFPEVK